MALGALGLALPYERVLRTVGTASYGAPFRRLAGLSVFGVSVQIKRGSLAALSIALQRGECVIAAVQTSHLPYWSADTDHAVLVVAVDESSVYLHDPALAHGPVAVSVGDFDLAWLEKDELMATINRVRQ